MYDFFLYFLKTPKKTVKKEFLFMQNLKIFQLSNNKNFIYILKT